MFTENTVFILGAGASTHYNYPTGEELIRLLITKAKTVLAAIESAPRQGSDTVPRWLKAYDNLAEAGKAIGAFIDRITHINPLVTDYFLGQNADLKEIGKVLIAAVILDCDCTSKNNGKEDWYKFVLHELVNGCKNAGDLVQKNKVTFITFNYDVSLERHFYSRLSAMDIFKDSGDAIRNFLEDSVIHFYGSVGDKYNKAANVKAGKTGGSLDALTPVLDLAYNAKDGINIIDPDDAHHAREHDIHNAIKKAKNIYILGYGFDAHNNERIGLNRYLHPLKNRNVFFTNYKDSNRINKLASKLLFNNYDEFLSYKKPIRNDKIADYWCEKSTQDVYNALRTDFEFFNIAREAI